MSKKKGKNFIFLKPYRIKRQSYSAKKRLKKHKECDILKEKGKPHYDKIDELIENAREKGSYNSTEIRDEYLSTHPDFRFLYYDIESRSEEIRKKPRHQPRLFLISNVLPPICALPIKTSSKAPLQALGK